MTGTAKKSELCNVENENVSLWKKKIIKKEILENCRKHLPYFKCPKVVVYSDNIPVTSTIGKYQRNKVKNLFIQWKEMQFKKLIRY